MTSDRPRLAICLLVAAALHVAVVLSVEFPERRLPVPIPAIDVVLRDAPAPTPPSPKDPPVHEQPTKGQAVPELRDPVVAAPPEPPSAVEALPPEASPTRANLEPQRRVLADTTTRDIARAITAHAQQLSKTLDDTDAANGESSPRIRRLTGPPNSDPELAYYLDSWRRKVERIGKINYPREARERGVSGTLRLLVVLGPDGELKDVRVIASSGHALLDDGAVRIVKLAAPFSPFTSKMRDGFDLLEIERTWRFQKDRLSPSL